MLSYQKIFLTYKTWLNQNTVLAEATRITYLNWIQYLINYLRAFDIQKLNDVDNQLVHNFVSFHKDKVTGELIAYATAYAKSRLAALDLFFNWSYQAGYCRENPVLRYKKAKLQSKQLTKSKPPKATARSVLTEKEIKRLEHWDTQNDPQLIRNKCIVLLILASALYAEEMITLTVQQLKVVQHTITITASKPTKQADKPRKIPLEQDACYSACQTWLKTRETLLLQSTEWVFFNSRLQPLTKRLLYKIVSETLAAVHITKAHRGPEMLRQTAIHFMLKTKTREAVHALTGIKNLDAYE